MENKKKAQKTWKRFVQTIKEENRFFIDKDITNDFIKIINGFKIYLIQEHVYIELE